MKRKVKFLTLVCLFFATNAAFAEDYNAVGSVKFSNLQAFLADPLSAVVPLKGKQVSDFNGRGLQTGSITANSAFRPLDDQDQLCELQDTLLQVTGQSINLGEYPLILTFTGVQGPNPQYGGRPLQLIIGRGGQVQTTWEATFFIFISVDGSEAILVGDGDFTVVGGTGQNANATGSFRTIFITVPTALELDASEATYWQYGEINR